MGQRSVFELLLIPVGMAIIPQFWIQGSQKITSVAVYNFGTAVGAYVNLKTISFFFFFLPTFVRIKNFPSQCKVKQYLVGWVKGFFIFQAFINSWNKLYMKSVYSSKYIPLYSFVCGYCTQIHAYTIWLV